MNMRQNTAESILSEKTFREAERERGGNDAFASSRECSWADFNALPLPNRRMEEWRFASLSGVRFEDFSLPGGAVLDALAQDRARAMHLLNTELGERRIAEALLAAEHVEEGLTVAHKVNRRHEHLFLE